MNNFTFLLTEDGSLLKNIIFQNTSTRVIHIEIAPSTANIIISSRQFSLKHGRKKLVRMSASAIAEGEDKLIITYFFSQLYKDIKIIKVYILQVDGYHQNNRLCMAIDI
ncbi:hypothetical protein SNEBB_003454 [Seison nebaliae]|nr:hypothetical protein SNEBB_003454 [Seison nebaliae]